VGAIDLTLDLRRRKAEAELWQARQADLIAKAKGDRGEPGTQGPKGDPGERGPMPRHQWQGTLLRFEQPDGTWGRFTDLQGPKGTRGPRGGGGGGAGSSFDPTTLPLLPDAPRESDYLVLERGGIAYRVSIGSLESIFGRSELTPYSVTVQGEPVTVNTVQVEATP